MTQEFKQKDGSKPPDNQKPAHPAVWKIVSSYDGLTTIVDIANDRTLVVIEKPATQN